MTEERSKTSHPTPADDIGLDDAADSWDVLAEQLEAFIEAWETDHQPPPLGKFLPAAASALQQMVLVELIKVDLEFRYQNDTEKRHLEDYAEEFPVLASDGGIPADLIFEEFHVRRTAGENVETADYLDRFPEREEQLRQLLAIDDPAVTTSFGSRAMITDINAGDKLDDFDLLVELGKGAFGCVFLARQQSMQRLVALKVSGDKGTEPQTLAQLDHPNIVRVYDQRQLADRHARMMYMQYVAGGTLESVVKRLDPASPQDTGQVVVDVIAEEVERTGGFVSMDATTRQRLSERPWPEIVCEWGAQMASALGYAHDEGVLHRDVKPANVLLAADGTPKLADFNISFSSQLDGATPAAYFGGSLAYMSPEQLEACNVNHPRQPAELDGRSDLYSLAVVLWELLHGERPFGLERVKGGWTATLESMAERRLAGVELPDGDSQDQLVGRLQRVLIKCLAADRSRRFADGSELAQALRLCLNPRAAKLLQPATGWRTWTASHGVIAMLIAAVFPNALAGVFAFIYNKQALDELLQDSQHVFWNTQAVINGIAFPVGMVFVAWFAWPVARAICHGETDSQAATVARALRQGHFIALVGVVEWSLAGIAYPMILHWLVGGLGAANFLHFVVSHVLSGLIAAAYPFFIASVIAIRVFVPSLLSSSSLDTTTSDRLQLLSRQAGRYVVVAGGVPALGVLALATAGLFTTSHNTLALFVLSILGFAGFGLVFLLYRTIQQDVAALNETVARDL